MLVWPPSLARIAAYAPWWVSMTIGAAGIAAFPAILLGGMVASVAEPYATLHAYFSDTVRVVLILMAIAFPIAAALLLVARTVYVSLENHRTGVYRLRGWAMTPVLAVLPMSVWCVATMIVDVRDPSFGLGVGIKPAWIYSPLFTVLGFKLWPLFLLIALFVIANKIATLAAHLVPRTFVCPNCAYDLRGLSGRICPECGTDVRAPEATTRLASSSKNPF